MSKKKKKICALDTIYSLFLYFLIIGLNEDDLFIFTSGIPKSIRENLKHFYFPEVKIYSYFKSQKTNKIKFIYKNLKGYLKYGYGILKLRFYLLFITFNKDIELYGHGHVVFSFMFYECKKSFLIEDGIANYFNLKKTKKLNPVIEELLHFCGVYIYDFKEGFGTHENIKKVYLTKDMAPDEIKDKVEIVNLKELWKNKQDEEKEKILSIFNINKKDLESLNGTLNLLLTQPFSEDNIISIDEEIKIYKNIINKHDSNDIIIKTHPREKKDYESIFPNAKVIKKPFPVELLEIFDINVKKIITVSSSAALNFENSKIEVYKGETFSEEIDTSRNVLKEKIAKKKY